MMVRIRFYNVRIITNEMIENGLPSVISGRQRGRDPNIQNGFLVYENLDGGIDGVNLSGVAKFIIEPQPYEEKE
ncbi:hypothetical protein [Citrobacter portucalensis]